MTTRSEQKELSNSGPSQACAIDEKPAPPRGLQAFLKRALWMILATTLVVFLIILTLGHVRLSHSGMSLLTSLLYTACIALPSIFLLTRSAERYTDRFPRLIFVIQAAILVVTATCGAMVAAAILVATHLIPTYGYWHELRVSLPFDVTIAVIFGLSISSYETLRYRLQHATLELRTRQVEQERAYKLLAEARLSSLESRIHPHFLFNTLNSIASLIPSDPVRAEQTVGNLASLLRFSLNANHGGMVEMAQEAKVLRDYLEIEKTRFGARLRYEIDLPAALDRVKVPPLALQSLAENAVKHVVSKRADGGSIRITGASIEGRVVLEVTDDGPGFSLDAITPEHGLGNLVERMRLLYGPDARLEAERTDAGAVVRLSFSL